MLHLGGEILDLNYVYDEIKHRISLYEYKDKNAVLAYDDVTNRVFEITNKEYEVLNLIKKNYNIDKISNEFYKDPDDVKKIIINVYKNLVQKNIKYEKGEKVLRCLEVVITCKCNLKCIYCNYENIKSDCEYMKTEDACLLVDRIFKQYDKIETIYFNGGEPMFNIQVVDAICDYILSKYKNGEIQQIPRYLLKTNLTILTYRALYIIDKYNINVKIRLDGDKAINDSLRQFKNEKGSFDIVYENIKKLNDYSKSFISISILYTFEHLIKGYTYQNIINYFYNEFGIKYYEFNNLDILNHKEDCTDLALSDRYQFECRDYDELINLFLSEGIIESKLINYINKLFGKDLKHGNYMDFTKLIINTDGNIYPCRLFDGKCGFNNKLCIGNIFSSEKNDNFTKNKFHLMKKLSTAGHMCKSCGTRLYCKMDLDVNLVENGIINSTNKKQCCIKKSRNEQLIKSILDTYADRDKRKLMTARLSDVRDYLLY